ncbi:MAG: putative ABC transporter permease [Candidatus Pacearchaeota archaeon]
MISKFFELLFLFLVGSLIGYVLELIYRNLIDKEYINPGFLKGPYVPIYGFGLILLNLFSYLPFNLFYKIILFGVVATLLELLTGLFFLKFFKLKLWDYSYLKFNYKGIIAPLFSIYWIILSWLYSLFLHPLMNSIFEYIFYNSFLLFFSGVLFGIILIDFGISFNLSYKIRKIFLNAKAKKKNLSFREFRNRTKIELNDKLRKYFKNHLKNKGVK